MLDAGAIILILLIGAAATGMAVALMVFWLRRRRSLNLARAWKVWETQPDAALVLFRRVMPRRRSPGKEPWRTRVSRLWLGQALCLFQTGRISEAEKALAAAKGLAEISRPDHLLLCRAYLKIDPTLLHDAAIRDLALLLAFPEDACDPPLRVQVEQALRRQLIVTSADAADRLQRVVEHAQQVIAAAPDLVWAHASLGIALAGLQRWREALPWLEKANRLDPGQAPSLVALGRVHFQLGNSEQAQTWLLQAYRLAPSADLAYDAATACLAWADQLEERQEQPNATLQSALELLTAVVKELPAHGAAWEALGQVQWRLGRKSDAIESMGRAIAISPKSAPLHALLGEYLLACGDRAKARAALTKACQLEPHRTQTVELVGDLAFEDGDYRSTITWYRRLHRQGQADDVRIDRLAEAYFEVDEPDHVIELMGQRTVLTIGSRLLLGRSQGRKNHWQEAMTTLEQVDCAQASPEYHYYLASSRAANGRFSQAEPLLRGLLDNEIWQTRARRQLAHIKLLQGEYATAGELYGQHNGDATTAFDLGRLALLNGDAQAARGHFETALAHNPTDQTTRFAVAYADAELGNLRTLKRLFAHAFPAALEELANRDFANRDYVDATTKYEQTLKRTSSPSTALLARIAVAYLQSHRYREALSHLVELCKRSPEDRSFRLNLILCRYQLGRAYYAKSQWEAARKQFQITETLFRPVDAAKADVMLAWELEAGYREAVRLLEADSVNRSQLLRACKLLEYGCRRAPKEGRWSFTAALAYGLAGEYVTSTDYFAQARQLLPANPSVLLGLALSLQKSERGDAARQVMKESLRLLENHGSSPEAERLKVATRFALAMSCARDLKWLDAAAELQGLLEHPLLTQSKRIKSSEVAQAAVAYYTAAGDKERASKLAQQHLEGSSALNNVLLGLIQADAGDYEGAVKILEEAYADNRQPEVGNVLIACLLAVVAAAIRKGDLARAESLVKRVLRYSPAQKTALSLCDALAFAANLANLDVGQLDQTIQQLQRAFDAGDRSPMVVRSLATMYHRKAVQAEAENRSPDQAWQTCIDFWKSQILTNTAFWDKYTEAYNTGKGRRERLQPEDVAAWREALPSDMAKIHVKYAREHLQRQSAAGLTRHLGLIWQWDPQFAPGDDFLLSEIPPGQLNDSLINFLEGALSAIKNRNARQGLLNLVAVYWCKKGSDLLNRQIEMINATIEKFGAGPFAAMAIETFKPQIREALRLVAKARQLAPGDAWVSKQYDWAREQCRTVNIYP